MSNLKRYVSIDCGIRESRKGNLLRVEDVINLIDNYILDDDSLVQLRLQNLLDYLRDNNNK